MGMNQLGGRREGRRQSGSVAVIVAFSLFVFIGVMAFVVDLGRWWVVRNELQNAADASALNGTGYLFNPPIGSAPATPNWALATANAQSAVSLNSSENVALATGDVTPGYWDFSANTFDTNTAKVPTINDLPAVRVVITRTAAQNAGPMVTILAGIFGSSSLDATATATAVISYPQAAGPGALAPIAIGNCILEAGTGLWNPTTKSPVINPGTGQPWEFIIASGAAGGTQCGTGCQCGTWTTFDVDNNSASYVDGLIQSGNSTPLGVGDSTWIQPGVAASNFGSVDTYLKGQDIIVPVVNNSALGSKGGTPVLNYACIHVDAGIQGGAVAKVCNEFPSGVPLKYGDTTSNKCVIGHFVDKPCVIGTANGGGGPFNGVYVPPRLVQ